MNLKPSQVPASAYCSRQMDLFQELLCNSGRERAELSHAVPLWHIIPRYSISSRAVEKLRDENGFLGIRKFSFVYERSEFQVEIHPVLIEEEKDGKLVTVAYYPTAADEVVEDVLLKMACDRGAGFYSGEDKISGVRFSLYSLRQELSCVGRTKSYDQIVKSLQVLSGSVIQVEGEWKGQKIKIKSPYLPQVLSVRRADLIKDPQQRWLVHFHPLISNSIANRNYRQFNFIRLMKHTKQLTRWLHKLLIANYTFASVARPFEIQFSRIRRDSKMLDGYSRIGDALSECEQSIKELKDNGVILSFKKTKQLGPRNSVIDVIYSLVASPDFVREVKASNKRLKPDAVSIDNR